VQYLLPWAIVMVAGLATVAGIYALTRPMASRFWKSLLRSLAVVVLMLPAPVPGFEGRFAPAFLVALFEGLFQPSGEPWPALKLLGAGVLAVVVIVTMWHLTTRNRPPANT
tara:strand:- start:3882 stop:4214 length:333 start_codon:yes stop_codon:yes gene_type:complete